MPELEGGVAVQGPGLLSVRDAKFTLFPGTWGSHGAGPVWGMRQLPLPRPLQAPDITWARCSSSSGFCMGHAVTTIALAPTTWPLLGLLLSLPLPHAL